MTANEQKKTRYIVGDGTNVSDFTYVTNVAYSHLLAACELRRDAPICGQAYFITNRKPISFWSVTTHIFTSLGYEQPWLPLPKGPMTLMARGLSHVTNATGLRFTFDMQAVKYITRHHFYDTDKALRDFGYKPAVGMTEALERTLASAGKDALANPNQAMPVPPPKFNTMLMSTMVCLVSYFCVALSIRYVMMHGLVLDTRLYQQ
jgi:nucleoside-diphosphate-sugar epimerase